MMSKNEMKANHNRYCSSWLKVKVGKYDVKERDESKSQQFIDFTSDCYGWQI